MNRRLGQISTVPNRSVWKRAAAVMLIAGAASSPAIAQEQPEVDEESGVQKLQPVSPDRPFDPRVDPARAPGNRPGQPDASRTGSRSGSVVQPPGAAAPGANPGVAPNAQALQPDEMPPTEGDDITLTAFSEPVELQTLVDYVAMALKINVVVKQGLTGSIVFNAPVSVPRSRLLTLLDALLEQQGFTITFDPASNFYSVIPSGEVPVKLADIEGATTRIFPTPNVRPSALKSAIDAQLGSGGGQPGQPTPTPGVRQYAYVDELGVIVATDTPRKLAAVESLVARLLEEYAKARFIRLELTHVAAPVARERALQLVGQGSGRSGLAQDPNQQVQQPGFPFGGSRGFDNLGDRLTIDPQGNALIFRGVPAEIEQVQTVLSVIDVPSKLSPKSHEVGKAAKQIAEIARQRGLGEVTQIVDTSNANPNDPFGFGGGLTFDQNTGQPRQTQQSATGGPVMVVDEARGLIIYYGTDEQQAALTALVNVLKTDDDRIVIREYKLRNAKAETVAAIVLGVIQNQTPNLPDASSGGDEGGSGGGGSSLLGGFRGDSFGDRRNQSSRFRGNRQNSQGVDGGGAGGGDGELSIEAIEDIFVVADRDNNQVLVKAPIREQEALEKLITKLDLRRPQVYIEAKIVSVTWTDDLRLAFETQLINANGTGGVLNTNFGLSGFGTGGITTRKNVATGLSGLTAAIIKSDQVPIVMNALQTEVDGRLLSTPQLLVDDNQTASIDSKDQQPTTRTDLGTGGNPNSTTFDGYVDAGTKLSVTPSISEAGYIRLEYEINLSSFLGEGSNGVPPPKQDNTLTSESVTVPSDSTVVLGGITLEQEGENSSGVPFLKDIPVIGLLFQDYNKNKRQTTLYVFLTPRIMRDPNFADLRLQSEGPQAAVDLPLDTPELEPSYIDSFDTRRPASSPEAGGAGRGADEGAEGGAASGDPSK